MTQTALLNSITTRRSIHTLKPELPTNVTIKDVHNVIQTIIKDTPTAFNSQGQRAIIFTGETHKKVWDHIHSNVPIEEMKRRPQSIRDEAYGSIFFFIDEEITENSKAEHPRWAEGIPRLVDHSSGAAQMMVWTVLEDLGLGCNLQH